MKFVCLIYEDELIFENKTLEEKRAVLARHRALREQLDRDGVEYTGLPLMPTRTARSVRVRGGRPEVTDGPFAETREQLAGFYAINCEDFDAAVRYATLLPNSETGTIEIREPADHSQLMG